MIEEPSGRDMGAESGPTAPKPAMFSSSSGALATHLHRLVDPELAEHDTHVDGSRFNLCQIYRGHLFSARRPHLPVGTRDQPPTPGHCCESLLSAAGGMFGAVVRLASSMALRSSAV